MPCQAFRHNCTCIVVAFQSTVGLCTYSLSMALSLKAILMTALKVVLAEFCFATKLLLVRVATQLVAAIVMLWHLLTLLVLVLVAHTVSVVTIGTLSLRYSILVLAHLLIEISIMILSSILPVWSNRVLKLYTLCLWL